MGLVLGARLQVLGGFTCLDIRYEDVGSSSPLGPFRVLAG